jgi:hypothetical protein
MPPSYDVLVYFLYKRGDILNLPDPDDYDDEAQEIIGLTSTMLPGKALSDMIIEDRGPR